MMHIACKIGCIKEILNAAMYNHANNGNMYILVICLVLALDFFWTD